MKKLYRSRTNAKLAGVCGGIAEYFNVDATMIRLVTVVAMLFAGTGVLAYIICAIIIPQAPESPPQYQDHKEPDNNQYHN